MCDVSDGFRLCTCPGGAEPDWLLFRRGSPDRGPLELMRGFSPIPTEDDELRKLFIVDGLEEGGCFDFDYEPADGDVLSFPRLGSGGSSFQREAGRWRITHQDGYDLGLEEVQRGQLELAAEQGLKDVPLWQAFLENPADEGLRAVVVDWLLETGRATLARWFQLEEAHARGEQPAGFRATALKVSLHLRARFARAPLKCDHASCDGDWAKLVRTPNPLSRRCLRCRRHVEFIDHGDPHSSKKTLWVAAPSALTPEVDPAPSRARP